MVIRRLAFLSCLFAWAAGACQVYFRYEEVGPDFGVQVTNQGKPVDGLLLRLEPEEGGPSDSVRTGPDGLATFRDVRRGAFTIRAEHDGGGFAVLHVRVNVKAEGLAQLRIEWSNVRALAVRSLAGSFRAYPSLAEQATLSLRDAVTGRPIASTQLDRERRFAFDGVPEGLYFVDLVARHDAWPAAFTMAVAVKREARAERLDLSLMWSSCGIQYVNLEECRASGLRLSRLAGEVRDGSGAAVPGAEVRLADREGRVVWRAAADGQGRFSAEEGLTGTYRLSVEHPTFQPVEADLSLGSGGGEVSVQMGILSQCGSARVR